MERTRPFLLMLAAATKFCSPVWLRVWLCLPLIVLASTNQVQADKLQLPLPELPKVKNLAFKEPKAEVLGEVDALLERLVVPDLSQRETAVREVLEAKPEWVHAIYFRLNRIAEGADRSEMKRLLLAIRRDTREAIRRALRAAGDNRSVDTPDYFEMVATAKHRKAKAWRDLVQVLGLSRMLVQIRTVEAVRALIHVFVRFDFLRIDTQLQLKRLGDHALPALIETRRHEARKVSHWARAQLDAIGKSIPSEAVQVDDPEILANVLRAFGRIRDPDAARIVISFANSERSQVREAARQAVALMGEVANWQLRDTYESIVGKRPERDWRWERTARELFGEFDKLRVSSVYATFERGQALYEEKQLNEMYQAYNQVLTSLPLFEQRAEMVPGYVEYAKTHADTDREAALDALNRAERLANTERTDAITSLRLTLEYERLREIGVVDYTLLERALKLDPSNERARSLSDAILENRAGSTWKGRYLIALTILVAAALAVCAILLLPRFRAGKLPT